MRPRLRPGPYPSTIAVRVRGAFVPSGRTGDRRGEMRIRHRGVESRCGVRTELERESRRRCGAGCRRGRLASTCSRTLGNEHQGPDKATQSGLIPPDLVSVGQAILAIFAAWSRPIGSSGGGLSRNGSSGLKLQQAPLHRYAAPGRVSSEPAIGGHHPMARDHDRQRIRRHGGTDSAGRPE